MRHILSSLLTVTALVALMGACSHKPSRVVSIEAEQVFIDSTFDAVQDSAYLVSLQPLKDSMDRMLNEVIGYVPEPMSAYQPESPLLNWAADAMLFPIRAKLPDRADFSVVNIGGLRCSWAAGDLTVRSIFELMPFENQVVILTLGGADVLLLADQMAVQGGQGVSGMTYVINAKTGKAEDVRVQGKPVEAEKDYYVVTSDYLSGGADGMDALTLFKDREYTGIKMRGQFIDYVKTLTANNQPVACKCDGRVRVRN